MRPATYVLGNDLHRSRLRPAVVIQTRPDKSVDLVIFCDPNEAQNEAGKGSHLLGNAVVYKQRIKHCPCDPAKQGQLDSDGKPLWKGHQSASFHYDSELGLDQAAGLRSLLEEQATASASAIDSLKARVAALESILAATTKTTVATGTTNTSPAPAESPPAPPSSPAPATPSSTPEAVK